MCLQKKQNRWYPNYVGSKGRGGLGSKVSRCSKIEHMTIPYSHFIRILGLNFLPFMCLQKMQNRWYPNYVGSKGRGGLGSKVSRCSKIEHMTIPYSHFIQSI